MARADKFLRGQPESGVPSNGDFYIYRTSDGLWHHELAPTAIQGVTGHMGLDGLVGDLGSTGIQGIQGDSGIQGDTGLGGVIGATGIGLSTVVDTFFLATRLNAKYGSYAAMKITQNSAGEITFKVPGDFAALVNVYCVLIPDGDVTGQTVTITSQYGSAGEQYDNHTSTVEIQVSFTQDQIAEVDISSAFSDPFSTLNVDDYAGLKWKNEHIGAKLYILGIKFVYVRG